MQLLQIQKLTEAPEGKTMHKEPGVSQQCSLHHMEPNVYLV